jgi:SAM-dependent methyltransferase
MNRWLRSFGIDPPTFYTSLKGLRRFWRDYHKIETLNSSTSYPWIIKPNYPCLHDFYGQSGVASGHYFHQDLYVAQKIFRNAPIKHVDVGSRIDGFVAHVASFRALEVFDYRELSPIIPNVTFRQFDLLSVPAQLDACCDSLSCLHVLEHIGLGRYGDPIDLSGHLRALESLAKLLKPKGTLYLSAPIGAERIEYNAHRVFSLKRISGWFATLFEIVDFSYVDDAGHLHTEANLQEVIERSEEFTYSLAIFELRRI